LGAIVRAVVVRVLREVVAARERVLRRGVVRRNGDMCLHGVVVFGKLS